MTKELECGRLTSVSLLYRPSVREAEHKKKEIDVKMKNKRVRKGISVLLSLSMVCALLLALSSCGGSKNTLVGNWEGKIDFTDMFNDVMVQSLGDEEAAEYIKISKLALDLSISFDKDGEYTMSIDEDGARKTMENMMGEVKDGLEKYFEKMISDQGLDMSVDDFFNSMIGSSFSDYIDEMMDVDMLMSGFDELEESGTYKTDGDELTLESDDGGKTEYTFELDGSKLTLDSDDDDMGIFPLELEKK